MAVPSPEAMSLARSAGQSRGFGTNGRFRVRAAAGASKRYVPLDEYAHILAAKMGTAQEGKNDASRRCTLTPEGDARRLARHPGELAFRSDERAHRRRA